MPATKYTPQNEPGLGVYTVTFKHGAKNWSMSLKAANPVEAKKVAVEKQGNYEVVHIVFKRELTEEELEDIKNGVLAKKEDVALSSMGITVVKANPALDGAHEYLADLAKKEGKR